MEISPRCNAPNYIFREIDGLWKIQRKVLKGRLGSQREAPDNYMGIIILEQ